jgi:hypothetical protein
MVGRGTCAPLFDVDGLRRDPGIETPLACQPLINNALEHFGADSTTKAIVITAYFAIYGQHVRLTTPATQNGVLLDELADTLRRLGRTGKPVILVHDVPEIPRACYRRTFPVWHPQPPADCTLPRDAYQASQQPVARLVQAVAGEFPNVSAYDPSAVLCDATRCGEIDDRHALYLTDGHHVNSLGAERLGAAVARVIEQRLAPQ